MQQPVETPTPKALADLIARCDLINNFETQLTAAEVNRINALASGILVMRQVLGLIPLEADKLPTRQARIQHWALTGAHLREAETPAINTVRGMLVLDEHEQVKVLSERTWRGQWRSVTLWHNKENGISSAEVMDYLSRLTALAQRRAPEVARGLLTRSEALATALDLASPTPRAGRHSGEVR